MRELIQQMQIKKLTKEPEKLLAKLEKVLIYYDLKERVSVNEIKEAIANSIKPEELARRHFSYVKLSSAIEAENLWRLLLDLYYNLPQKRYSQKSYLEFQAQNAGSELLSTKEVENLEGFSRDLSITEELEKDLERKLKGLKQFLGQVDAKFGLGSNSKAMFSEPFEGFSAPDIKPADLEWQTAEELIPAEHQDFYQQAVDFTIKANELIKPLINKKGINSAFKKLAFNSLAVSGKIVAAFSGADLFSPGIINLQDIVNKQDIINKQEEDQIQLDFLESGFAALQRCLEALATIKKAKLVVSRSIEILLELGSDLYFEYLKNIEGLRRKLTRTSSNQ